jgi:hypothetical protein
MINMLVDLFYIIMSTCAYNVQQMLYWVCGVFSTIFIYNKITSPKVQNLNLNKRTPTIELLKRKNEQ